MEKSFVDLVDELGERLAYGRFLNDLSQPVLEFEEWKARRPVPTNPATIPNEACTNPKWWQIFGPKNRDLWPVGMRRAVEIMEGKLFAASWSGRFDSGYDEDCSTLAEAITFINGCALGMDYSRAWINNREVKIRNCSVVMNGDQPEYKYPEEKAA